MRKTRGQQPSRLQLVLSLYSSSDSAGGARPGRCGAAARACVPLPAPGRALSATDTGWHMINAAAGAASPKPAAAATAACRRRLLPSLLPLPVLTAAL